MRNQLTAAPSVEPVTLAEAKTQCRVYAEWTDDDALLNRLISTARILAEVELSESLISTGWDLYLDAWPGGLSGGYFNRAIRQMGPGPGWLPSSSNGGVITFPRGPLLAVSQVEYLDGSGTLQVLDPSTYRVSTGKVGRIQPRQGMTWPLLGVEADAIRISYTAGYGADASTVPSNIKSGILLAVGSFYANRGDEAFELPRAARDVIGISDRGTYG